MFNRDGTNPLLQLMFEFSFIGLIILGLVGIGWAVVESVDAVHGQEWLCIREALNDCLIAGQSEQVCQEAAREICH